MDDDDCRESLSEDKMATETSSSEDVMRNGGVIHSRTSSSTSSNSTDDGLVLSVANFKAKRPGSGNNNSKHVECAETTSLRSEVEFLKAQLKAKDQEVVKLSQIRVELENEVQELTASLFEEAHKMVGAANIKAAASERSLEEASMKIEGLETEVAALKDTVLTSTPSKPNRHLHPQISNSKLTKLDLSVDSSSNSSGLGLGLEVKWMDPVVKKEFMAWKKAPTLNKETSDFLKRIFSEDVVPCLTFPNLQLTAKVMKAVEANRLSISPLTLPKDGQSAELPNFCSLFEASLVCHFKVTLEEEQIDFCVSQLGRNRIAAAVECINYLRYICEGLVKSHHNEVYWEIAKRRKRIMLAKMGFSPDDED